MFRVDPCGHEAARLAQYRLRSLHGDRSTHQTDMFCAEHRPTCTRRASACGLHAGDSLAITGTVTRSASRSRETEGMGAPAPAPVRTRTRRTRYPQGRTGATGTGAGRVRVYIPTPIYYYDIANNDYIISLIIRYLGTANPVPDTPTDFSCKAGRPADFESGSTSKSSEGSTKRPPC